MQDILKDIEQYNPQLTISKVIALFERKGLTVTKSMIQNYVRDGILPPPVNKRYYTPKHLAVLVLVNKLKTVYELAYIKAVLTPLMDKEGIPLEIYRQCIQKTEIITLPQCAEDTLALMAYSVDIQDEVINRLRREYLRREH